MNSINIEKKPCVILLGRSLLMESVANSLSKRNLEVIHMEYSPNDFTTSIAISNPDIIIFELDQQRSYPMLPLAKTKSNVLFLGLDMASCQLFVLNSHLRSTRNMDELYTAIIDELSIKAALERR